MSNTITHLAVAKEILKKCPALVKNEMVFYLGCIAPDTVTGKDGATRDDKKRVHLRENIPDAKWLEPEYMSLFMERISFFITEHIAHETDSNKKDFNIGYLVHLLTDRCNHETIRQKLLAKAGERGIVSSDREFYNMCVNDLEALDEYLLESRPELGKLFSDLLSDKTEYCLEGFIDNECIRNSMWWWENCYLKDIKKRELLYIRTEDIEEFITYSTEKIAGGLVGVK